MTSSSVKRNWKLRHEVGVFLTITIVLTIIIQSTPATAQLSTQRSSWSAQTQIPGVGTDSGPSLAVYNGILYMAWMGVVTGEPSIWYATYNNGVWSAQTQIPGVGTTSFPSLAVYNGILYMAWRGAGADTSIWYATYNNGVWSAQTQILGVGTSAGPSLAVYNGNLYMAWKGEPTDNRVFYAKYNGAGWSAQTPIPGIGTTSGPWLAVYNGILYMAWKGADYDMGIYYATYNGAGWSGQAAAGSFTGTYRPSLAVYNGILYMAWKGEEGDTGIYYATYNDMLTLDLPSQVKGTVDKKYSVSGSSQLPLSTGLHTILLPPTAAIDEKSRLRFDHWSDGSKSSNRTITLTKETTLTATYVTQYLLTVGSVVPLKGSGWYDKGSRVTVSAPTSSPIITELWIVGGQWVFDGWYKDGAYLTNSPSSSIAIDGPHSLQARWHQDYTSSIVILTLLGLAAFVLVLIYRRKKASNS
jgi:uncharacterized repeat protein (TIGR02543 family)